MNNVNVKGIVAIIGITITILTLVFTFGVKLATMDAEIKTAQANGDQSIVKSQELINKIDAVSQDVSYIKGALENEGIIQKQK